MKSYLFNVLIMVFFVVCAGCSKDENIIVNNQKNVDQKNEENRNELSITEFTPKNGKIGDEIKLTWENVNYSNQDISVTINDTPAIIKNLDQNNLIFVVPNDAKTGKIELKINNKSDISNEDLIISKLGHQPVYFSMDDGTTRQGLRSFTLNDEGGMTFKVENSNLRNYTGSIYYDKINDTFMWVASSSSSTYHFDFNPRTNETTKKYLGNSNGHLIVNTKINKKVFCKELFGFSIRHIFQELNENGEVTKESPEINIQLGWAPLKYEYDELLDAYVAVRHYGKELILIVVDASTFEVKHKTVSIYNDSSLNDLYDEVNYLNYDRINNKYYYITTSGIFEVNFNTQTATLLVTDWIEYLIKKMNDNDSSQPIIPIYYPPTNEIIIQKNDFYGASSGQSKFFAVNLTTGKTREIDSPLTYFYNVYNFTMKY